MNTLGIDYDADHIELERDRGTAIIWNNKSYPAVVSVPSFSREFDQDGSGYDANLNLLVSVRSAIIGSDISVGKKIIYDGTTYRIAEMQDSEDGYKVMTCQGVTR